MNCKNCNTALEDGAKLCPGCGKEVEMNSESRLNRKIWRWVAIIAGVVLFLSVLIFFLFIRNKTNEQQDVKTNVPQNTPVVKIATITPPSERITVTSPTPRPTVLSPSAVNPVPAQPDASGTGVKLSRPIPNLFYIRDYTVYHAAGDEIKPKPVTKLPPNGNDLLFLCVSEDGRKVLYPDTIDERKTDYTANLYAYDLTSESPERLKLDSGVNNFAISEDGTHIYYLKDKTLYASDGSQPEKLAEKVIEFYLSEKGDGLIYKTQDCRLFQVTQDKIATEMDTKVYLVYVSKDLNMIYYFKENSLYSLKNGRDIQMIASGIPALSENIIHIYDDGSLYYLKRSTLKASDYVNDDLAESDAVITQPIRSNYPDQQSYDKAYGQFEEKRNRDEIRQALVNSDSVVREVNSLYYYSNGVSTKISHFCSRVWRYSDAKTHQATYGRSDRPFLAYEQVRLDKIKLSDVTRYDEISEYILSYNPKQVEQYICKGASVLGKFADGELHQLFYDAGNNKIYYTNDYHEKSERSDLYFVETDGTTVSESRPYEKDIIVPYDPSSLIIGDSIVYLKNGINMDEDFTLFVNHEEIDSDVTGWIHSLSNSSSFLYENNMNDWDYYSQTLKLYQDGKVTKIADRVLDYHVFDENLIAFVVSSDNGKKQLYLYDGSPTRILLDTYSFDSILLSEFITPQENPYYAYWRPTVILTE